MDGEADGWRVGVVDFGRRGEGRRGVERVRCGEKREMGREGRWKGGWMMGLVDIAGGYTVEREERKKES